MPNRWPHLGLLIGAVLNTVGLLEGHDSLIVTGSNILTVSGFFLVQQKKNEDRDE